MFPSELSDDELLLRVVQKDTELLESGMEIKQRSFFVPIEVMKALGYQYGFTIAGRSKPAILQRIEELFESIYRPLDLAVGGHFGVFVYRDIFARIRVPRIYGEGSIPLQDFVELTDIQRRILCQVPGHFEALHDQILDVFDIYYGGSELKKPYCEIELVTRYIRSCQHHLHAGAAILTGGYDYEGAVQSALLATELALKSIGAAQGISEKDLANKNKFGHYLVKLLDVIEQCWPHFDAARVRRVIERVPNYVESRYAAGTRKRVDVGHIVMGAQYVAAEITRQMSDRNFRKNCNVTWLRRYPP
jgi:hypothetical protein